MVRVTRARIIPASRPATANACRSVGRGSLRWRGGGWGRGRGHSPRRAAMRRGETLGLIEARQTFPVLHDLAEAEAGLAQCGGDVLGEGSCVSAWTRDS